MIKKILVTTSIVILFVLASSPNRFLVPYLEKYITNYARENGSIVRIGKLSYRPPLRFTANNIQAQLNLKNLKVPIALQLDSVNYSYLIRSLLSLSSTLNTEIKGYGGDIESNYTTPLFSGDYKLTSRGSKLDLSKHQLLSNFGIKGVLSYEINATSDQKNFELKNLKELNFDFSLKNGSLSSLTWLENFQTTYRANNANSSINSSFASTSSPSLPSISAILSLVGIKEIEDIDFKLKLKKEGLSLVIDPIVLSSSIVDTKGYQRVIVSEQGQAIRSIGRFCIQLKGAQIDKIGDFLALKTGEKSKTGSWSLNFDLGNKVDFLATPLTEKCSS